MGRPDGQLAPEVVLTTPLMEGVIQRRNALGAVATSPVAHESPTAGEPKVAVPCEYESRCPGCPAAGLAPRTRTVLSGVALNALAGRVGHELEVDAKAYLMDIEPPKNAPQNQEVLENLADAATKIVDGECDKYQII